MFCPYVVYLPLIIKYWGDTGVLCLMSLFYNFSYDDNLLILTHTNGRLTTNPFSVVSHTKISNKLF